MIYADLIGILYMFAAFAIYFMLPLIPAIVIYLLFPKTEVVASGPLKGFKINTSGAFAAYFILLLMGIPMINSIYTQIIKGSNQLVTLDTKVEWLDSAKNNLDGQVIQALLDSNNCQITYQGQTIPSGTFFQNTLQDKFYVSIPASYVRDENHSCITFLVKGFHPACIVITDTAFIQQGELWEYKSGLKLIMYPAYKKKNNSLNAVPDGPPISNS